MQNNRFPNFEGPIYKSPVQDLAFVVTLFIQKGGSFVNQYNPCKKNLGGKLIEEVSIAQSSKLSNNISSDEIK